MSDNKHTVVTDALATLGTIIGPEQKRDAIHLAVDPVRALVGMNPGQPVRIDEGDAYPVPTLENAHGIVDPFLAEGPREGQYFWFIMKPRVITSLRHVWDAPGFPSVEPVPEVVPDKAASEAWLQQFCRDADCPGYRTTLDQILEGNPDTWDEDYLHFRGSDAHGDIPDEFWDHVEIVTGRKFYRAKYFSCSC